MIKSIVAPAFGRFVSITIWNNGGIPATLISIRNDEEAALNESKRQKKLFIRKAMGNFLTHRKNIMDYHGGIRTESTLKAWQEINANWDYIREKTLEAHCKMVLTLKNKIISLFPGEKSRYHDSTINKMNDLFHFCEEELQINNVQPTVLQ